MPLAFGGVVGISRDEIGESGWVLVDVGSWRMEVVVRWSIFRLSGVHKRMHFDGGAEGVERENVQNFELRHDRFCMRSWREIHDEADDSFLSSDERLEVRCVFGFAEPQMVMLPMR